MKWVCSNFEKQGVHSLSNSIPFIHLLLNYVVKKRRKKNPKLRGNYENYAEVKGYSETRKKIQEK